LAPVSTPAAGRKTGVAGVQTTEVVLVARRSNRAYDRENLCLGPYAFYLLV
jgi:hypothetical protein